MEPKMQEQLTELTEKELLETDGGFFKFGFGLRLIIAFARPGGPGDKEPNPGFPRL